MPDSIKLRNLLCVLILTALVCLTAPAGAPIAAQGASDAKAAATADWQVDFRMRFGSEELTRLHFGDLADTSADVQPSQQAGVDAAALASALDLRDLYAFNDDVIWQRLESAVRGSPASLETFALMEMSRPLFARDDNPVRLGELIESARGDAEDLDAGLNWLDFARFHARYLEASGNAQALDVSRNLTDGGLRNWLLCGPFAASGKGDYHFDMLPPELLTQFSTPYQGEYGDSPWRAWIPEYPEQSTFSLSDIEQRRGSAWFATTTIQNSGQAATALLEFGISSGGVKAWLNGQMVFNRRPHLDTSRDDVCMVELPAGESQLLVKFGGESSVSASVRVCRPGDRMTMWDVSSAHPTSVAPSVPGGSVPAVRNRFDGGWYRFAEQALNPQASPEVRSMCATLAAFSCAASNNRYLAEDFWELARHWRDADAYRRASLEAVYYSRETVLDSARSLSKRLEAFKTLCELDPNCIQGWLFTGEIHAMEDREQEANACFEKAIEVATKLKRAPWHVHLEVAEFYQRKGWSAEERDQRLRAWECRAEADQGYNNLRDRISLALSDSDTDTALRLNDLVWLRWPGDRTALNTRMQLVMDQPSELSESVWDQTFDAIVDLQGYRSRGMQRQYADARVKFGKWQEAYDIRLSIGNSNPIANGRDAMAAGEMAYAHGDNDRARFAFELALKRDPSLTTARTFLARLNGEALPVLPESATDLESATFTPLPVAPAHWEKAGAPPRPPGTQPLLKSGNADEYPLADACMLLDEEIWDVYADASVDVTSHSAVRALTQAGVDRYGSTRVSGELLLARSINREGKSFEPTSVRSDELQFPQFQMGNVVHYAMRRSSGGNDYRQLDGRSFTFADRDLRLPTLRSRLVVQAAPDMQLNWRIENAKLRNLHEKGPNDPRAITYRSEVMADGRVRHEWLLEAPRSIESEPNMPAVLEVLPRIVFERARDEWESAARTARRGYRDSQVTWLIRERVRELAQEQQGTLTARFLYNHVNRVITTDGPGDNPHMTLLDGAGSREDLMLAFFECAGFPWTTVAVSGSPFEANRIGSFLDGRRSPFSPTLLRVQDSEGSHLITLRWRQAPFGARHLQYLSSPYMEMNPVDGSWYIGTLVGAGTEDGLDADLSLGAHRETSMAMSADGSAVVVGRTLNTGSGGWNARESARTASDSDLKRELTESLNQTHPSLTVESFAIAGRAVDEPDGQEVVGGPFERRFTGSMSNMLQAGVQGRQSFALNMTGTRDLFGNYVTLDSRSFDLMLKFYFVQRDIMMYQLPEGYTLEKVPSNVLLPATPFNYRLTYSYDPATRRLLVERAIRFSPMRVPVEEYATFKANVQTLIDAESKRIVMIPIGE